MKNQILLLLFLVSFKSFSQKVEWPFIQWSCSVESCSHEYFSADYSPNMALGLPDAFLQRADALPNSYVLGLNQKAQKEEDAFVKVQFCSPQKANTVVIAENHAPGVITEVFIYDENNKEYSIYKGVAAPTKQLQRMFQIKFPTTTYKVSAVKIVAKPTVDGLFNAIDAVGIGDIMGKLDVPEHNKNLSYNVNTEYEESNPVLSQDEKTIFFSIKGHPSNLGHKENKEDIDVWKSELNEDGVWSKATQVKRPLNSNLDNKIIRYSKDGTKLYVTGRYDRYGVYQGDGISYFTLEEGDLWGKPTNIFIHDFKNKNEITSYDISEDEQVLIIAMNDKINGQLDLYVSVQINPNEYSKPKLMGIAINSSKNEISPRISADKKTLYFSSEGFGGLGSYDIFKSTRLDDSWEKWSAPYNLGNAVNTPNSDTDYYIASDQKHIYIITTNDSYGKGDLMKMKLN